MFVMHVVESAGSARGSREDLYSARNYRGSNSSLNDGMSLPVVVVVLVFVVANSA